ncbi:MAG: response regulator [Kiritimatiellaeota bacterium]|nr:response regulator [Kiritimatiellota bacterium]
MNPEDRSILVADDDPTMLTLLVHLLRNEGFEVVAVSDGDAAWEHLCKPDAPPMALLDWIMPGVNGVDLCRKVRELDRPTPTYLIMLTALKEVEDAVDALDTGADDYMTKPFNQAELHARIRAGFRIVELQEALAARIRELEEAARHIEQLQGILPICSYCKKIRDDDNFWQAVERYFSDHSNVRFSHSICPACLKEHFPELADEIARQAAHDA